jgi:alkyldihydroxyacetonephosphate synthase
VLNSYVYDMLYARLREIVGDSNISDTQADRMAYATDVSWVPNMWFDRAKQPSMPEVIVRPDNAEQIADIIKIATEYRVPVIPIAGGSGTQGGGLAICGGIMIDLKRMNKIIDIDEKSQVATVETGALLVNFERALNKLELSFPHYPASIYSASVGGCIAARGSGVMSTKYGKIEDLVLGLEVVLPTGTIFKSVPVPRNATGPELTQLFIGSEGTLGVITKARVKLIEKPNERSFRCLLFDNLENGMDAGRQIMLAGLRPAVIRLYDTPSTKSFVNRVLGMNHEGNVLILGFEGRRGDLLEMEKKETLKICQNLGAKDLGEEPGQHWWDHRYDFYYPPLTPHLPTAFGTMDSVTTFKDILPLYYHMKEEIEGKYSHLNARFTGHFSHWYPWGAMVYARFFIDEPPTDPHEAARLYYDVWSTGVNAALKHGGVVNEHHGIGMKLGPFMRRQYGCGFEVLEGIKKQLDPNNIMNPGKLGFKL